MITWDNLKAKFQLYNAIQRVEKGEMFMFDKTWQVEQNQDLKQKLNEKFKKL